MNSFKEFLLNEAGQPNEQLELLKTKIVDARKWIKDHGIDLDSILPNFDANYKAAQKKAGAGWTIRKNMPIIRIKDVKNFQLRLQNGRIDIAAPYAPSTSKKNPFPTGLSGDKAKTWLTAGLYDGETEDDKVAVKYTKIAASNLKPIQKQIFVDKAMEIVGRLGIDNVKKLATVDSFLIVSKDNYVLDGHHRFLMAMLIDPKLKVNTLQIDLSLKKLLPLAVAYGDAVGNSRNR